MLAGLKLWRRFSPPSDNAPGPEDLARSLYNLLAAGAEGGRYFA
jgi:hypothetical protein